MKTIQVKLFIYFLVSSLFISFAFMSKSFSQENENNVSSETIEFEGSDGKVTKLDVKDLEKASRELEENARAETDPQKKNLLQKLSAELKDLTKKSDKKKKKLSFKKIGHALGKGSTFVAVQTARPFLNAAGFLTGFFEKPEKNKESIAFINFVLNHDEDLKDVYKTASTPEDYLEKLQEKINEILVLKSAIILQDSLQKLGQPVGISCILKTLGVEPYQSDDRVSDLEHVVNMLEINAEDIRPELINEHPEFQELREIVGDVTQEQVQDFIFGENHALDLDFDGDSVIEGAKTKIHEGVIALAAQPFVLSTLTGVLSSTLGGIVGGGVIAADIGFVVSASMCLKDKEKIDRSSEAFDEDVRAFCSYVVNKSAYDLSKSRAKGYTKGKALKVKFKKFLTEKLGFGKKKAKKNKIEGDMILP